MSDQVTIVVVPRDRFSSVEMCVSSIIKNTDVPYRLAILDFGYSSKTLKNLQRICEHIPAEIVPVGRTIPMIAFQKFLPKISTRYTAWVDNDTFVTSGWLPPLLERAAEGARVISPVTLEREGLDSDSRKIPLRNHISHSELRYVMVGDQKYVFDYKPHRRAAPEEIPQDYHRIDYFELHTFFAETDVLRQLDYPAMVVREHIDIGIQLHHLGVAVWCEPRSVVHFDNIHERPSWGDLQFFFFRWDEKLIDQSHDLFEQRWKARFLSEWSIRNWAYRRKIFSVGRFVGLPHRVCDLTSRGMNKLFRPGKPANLPSNPIPESKRELGEKCEVATVSA